MYSFLQFLGSPIIGALSDIYGRKPVMLVCLTGISLSYLIWAFSTNFGIFVLARFFGGISKGNISLSMAIISDVTSAKTRGQAMVGNLLSNEQRNYHSTIFTIYKYYKCVILINCAVFVGTGGNSFFYRFCSGTDDRGVFCLDFEW